MVDGVLVNVASGVPQGSGLSPLLYNLIDYAVDSTMMAVASSLGFQNSFSKTRYLKEVLAIVP